MSDRVTSYAVLGALALIGAAGAYLYFRGAKGAASDAVNAAGNIVAGVAEGVGDQLGVPHTDEAKCQAAMAAGEKFNASKFCTAPVFLSWAVSGFPRTPAALASSPARPDLGYRRYADPDESVGGP